MRDRKPATSGQPADSTATKRAKASASLGPDIQAKIGRQLRAYYAGLIEPTPDRFVELLRKLDKPGGKDGKDGLNEG
jgi:anti-sigma factor NepR-like protein